MLKSSTLFLLLLLTSCSTFRNIPQPSSEFRGFWVATVVNIDWPKNGKDSIEKQKADFIEILDFYQNLNFNTAIVQVRTAGDAFYESKFAPWSRFLTGTEGEAPKYNEDLLKWMIDATHSHGMEFHAWLNPYRATFDLKTEILSPAHDFNTHPEWMLKYGKKYYYDPGLPEVQQHMVSIIKEIVSNYDIDAIHFDDYFYPYTIKDEVFQDATTYFNCGLPQQSLGDWRRSNIDSLVKKTQETIKNKKPWVQFGISPFGVWKNKATDPKGSDTRAGQTTYENLYADPLLWIENDWIDYLIPQVYWSMDFDPASHRKIVDWWSNNSKNTNLYIGNGPYKIRSNSDLAWNNKKELPNQLLYGRQKPIVKGNAFFSAKSLMNNNNDDVVRYMKRNYYKWPAAIPSRPSSNQTEQPPTLISISQKADDYLTTFSDLSAYRFIHIYPARKNMENRTNKQLLTQLFVTHEKQVIIPKEEIKGRRKLTFVFVDKYGRQSEPRIVHLNKFN